MKDPVTITCYRQTEIMERNDAIEFYKEGIRNSDGHERNRYMNILIGLLDGEKEVSDDDLF